MTFSKITHFTSMAFSIIFWEYFTSIDIHFLETFATIFKRVKSIQKKG